MTVRKRYNKLTNDTLIVTEYPNMETLHKDIPDITGADKIWAYTILDNDLSVYYGRSIVTTDSDILNSSDGGFITYAEKFLIAKDISSFMHACDFISMFLLFMRDEKNKEIMTKAYQKMSELFIYHSNANRWDDTIPFAFDLDNFDIAYYGILKGWFDPI